MFRSWSFGRVVAASLIAIAALTVLCGGVSIYALEVVTAGKDSVISVNAQRRLAVESLRVAREQRAKAFRSYLISRDDRFLAQMREMQGRILAGLEELRASRLSGEERRLLDRIDDANAEVQAAWVEIAAERKGGAEMERVVASFERLGPPRVKALDDAMSALADHEAELLTLAQGASTASAEQAIAVVAVIVAAASLLGISLAVSLSRRLHRQLGAAIGDVQGSSAELDAAASAQVESAERLTVVTAEITTTIQELLAASRQISESAQRVARAAEETAEGAGGGDDTVQRAQEALLVIKRHVDLILCHMLDLDKKSQEIGAILGLIREFAEQTNILSINATIEAAGAGAAGKRFAVVADEIQRLADRVGGSTRDIHRLIEEIRGAASSTMVAIEDGKRAVDSGARQFNDVIATFKQIATRSRVTTEAAREIELSTRQQATAVEQVSVAISGVGQAAQEAQESSGRALTTSAELGAISRRLAALIRRER